MIRQNLWLTEQKIYHSSLSLFTIGMWEKHRSRCKLICPHSPVPLTYTGLSFLHACSHRDIQCFHYKNEFFFLKGQTLFFHAAPIFLFFKEVDCMVNDSCGNVMVVVIIGHNIINLIDLCDLD